MSITDASGKMQLQQMLTCPVCQDIFKDPRLLPCGHSLCLQCIQSMADHSSGVPFRCPTCREYFGQDIYVQKNYTLSSIVEEYGDRSPEEQEKTVYCDCCPGNQTLAVKTCLKCEVSLCQTHVKSHQELPVYTGHPLVQPLSDLHERKCPQHEDEVLRYYCRTTRRYICNLCSLRSKQTDLATQTCNVMRRQLTEYMNQQLKVLQENVSESTTSVKQLQEEIQQERKRMNTLDSCFNSVTVVLLCLWFIVLYYAYNYSVENQKLTDKWEQQDKHVRKLHTKLADMKLDQGYSCQWQTPVQSHDDETMLLDVDSASPLLSVSEDGLTVLRLKKKAELPSSRHRFTEVPQVLSAQCFSSGTHIWEVQASGYWEIAASFRSIPRRVKDSSFGNNPQSWSLAHNDKGELYAFHNKQKSTLAETLKTSRVTVTVNFVKGSILFSAVGQQVTRLHEFSAELTEPVCLGIGLYRAELASSATIIRAFRVKDSPV